MGRTRSLKNQMQVQFMLSILFAIISSVAILGISVVEMDQSIYWRIGAYLLAAVFWVSLLIELIVVKICSLERRQLEQKKPEDFEAVNRSRAGVISFGKTQGGKAADVLLMVSILAIILVSLISVEEQWVTAILISVLYLSFNLHCLLNGKNFRCIILIINKKGRRQNE